MTDPRDPNEPAMAPCICEPFSEESRALGCEGCAPSMYLTCEEETILTHMRGLKGELRSISERMREIERLDRERTGEPVGSSEWSELKSQLDDLRGKWREWEVKLDQAIEQKLILLGHREQ
ncbi:MAG: hypothetical protein AB1733_13525 [Thermodesulfobacteriota bacterium]